MNRWFVVVPFFLRHSFCYTVSAAAAGRPPIVSQQGGFIFSRVRRHARWNRNHQDHHGLLHRPLLSQEKDDGQSVKVEAETEAAGFYKCGGEDRSLMGGDYAGITVHLDEKGRLLPLSDFLVPRSMREWGQVPDFVETLVSEDWIVHNNNNNATTTDTAPAPALPRVVTRHVLTIIPETGCSVDNMEVIKRVEKLERVATSTVMPKGMQCLVWASSPDQWRVETVFDSDSMETPFHRLRVGVLMTRVMDPVHEGKSTWSIVPSNQFSSPSIQISWEHKYRESSSSGTVADGGGLDAQSVSRWMGVVISKQSSTFAKSTRRGENQNKNQNERLYLPGNLTLSWGNDSACDSKNKQLILQIENSAFSHEQRILWNFSPDDTVPTKASVTMGPSSYC